jgi:hypothetical protein
MRVVLALAIPADSASATDVAAVLAQVAERFPEAEIRTLAVELAFETNRRLPGAERHPVEGV